MSELHDGATSEGIRGAETDGARSRERHDHTTDRKKDIFGVRITDMDGGRNFRPTVTPCVMSLVLRHTRARKNGRSLLPPLLLVNKNGAVKRIRHDAKVPWIRRIPREEHKHAQLARFSQLCGRSLSASCREIKPRTYGSDRVSKSIFLAAIKEVVSQSRQRDRYVERKEMPYVYIYMFNAQIKGSKMAGVMPNTNLVFFYTRIYAHFYTHT